MNQESQKRRCATTRILFFILLPMFFGSMTGCTAYKEYNRTDFSYQAPEAKQIRTSKVYTAPYDKVWESVISFFAERNITIQTIEKVSGIVAAQKMYGDLMDAIDLIEPGEVEAKTIRVTEKKEPAGWVGSANASYVREHGRVVDTQEEVIETTTGRALYRIAIKFNVFCRKNQSDSVAVSINLQFEPAESVHGAVPRPVSKGWFEAQFFEYLDRRIPTP